VFSGSIVGASGQFGRRPDRRRASLGDQAALGPDVHRDVTVGDHDHRTMCCRGEEVVEDRVRCGLVEVGRPMAKLMKNNLPKNFVRRRLASSPVRYHLTQCNSHR